VKAPPSKISHVDLVVSSIERSLPFYRGLLEPIGWSALREAGGEQGETICYLSVDGPGVAALGLREKRSNAQGLPYDRYAVGVHHLCFDVPLVLSSTSARSGSAGKELGSRAVPRSTTTRPATTPSSSTTPTESSSS
jgi:hypothetical protein